MNIAKDIADYLQAQGAGTVGDDLFISKMPVEKHRPSDAPAAAILASGGFDPAANKDRIQGQDTVQILVAGIPDGYDDAIAFAQTIRDVLIAPLKLIVAPYTYYGSYAQGGIEPIGYDANKRPELSMNFRIYSRKENV